MAKTPLDLNKTAADWREWYHTTYQPTTYPIPAAAAPAAAASTNVPSEGANASSNKPVDAEYLRKYMQELNKGNFFINPKFTKGEDGQEQVTFSKDDLAKLFTYINPTQGMRNPEGARPQAVQPLPESVIAQLSKGSGG